MPPISLKQLTLSVFAAALLSLTACAPQTPPPAEAIPTPTNKPPTPIPTLDPTEKAIALAALSITPTALPTATLDPTQAVLFATLLPSPTSDGSPFPITWRTTPYTTYDGRNAWMVDDISVVREAEKVFEEWNTLMAFHDGFPPRDEFEKRLKKLIEKQDWIEKLLSRYDTFAKDKGYWKKPLREYEWNEQAVEFSKDGAYVIIHLRTEGFRGEWFNTALGRATHVQDTDATLWKVALHYNSPIGRWMLTDANAEQTAGPIVTVTPSK